MLKDIETIKKRAHEAVDAEISRLQHDDYSSTSAEDEANIHATCEYVDAVANNLIQYVDDTNEEMGDEIDDLFDVMQERIDLVERKIKILRNIGTFIFSAGVVIGFLITTINAHFEKKGE